MKVMCLLRMDTGTEYNPLLLFHFLPTDSSAAAGDCHQILLPCYCTSGLQNSELIHLFLRNHPVSDSL